MTEQFVGPDDDRYDHLRAAKEGLSEITEFADIRVVEARSTLALAHAVIALVQEIRSGHGVVG